MSSARASSASACSSSSMATPFLVARVQRIEDPTQDGKEIEARFAASEGARHRSPAAAAAGVRRNWSMACRPSTRPRRLADIVAVPDGRQAAGEAEDAGDRRSAHPAGHGARNPVAQRIEVLRLSQRDRRAHQGSDRRAPARVPAARAADDDPEGAWRRRRRHAAEIAELEQGHRRGQHAGRGREAGAQGTQAPASACRTARPNTRWCAPISTG